MIWKILKKIITLSIENYKVIKRGNFNISDDKLIVDSDNSNDNLDDTGINKQAYVLDCYVLTTEVQSYTSNKEDNKDASEEDTDIKHEKANKANNT